RGTVPLLHRALIAVVVVVRCVRADEVRSHVLGRALDSAREGRAPAQEPILSLTAVSAGYRKRMVVHDVTLQVAPRECLGPQGASGRRQTTLDLSEARLHPY